MLPLKDVFHTCYQNTMFIFNNKADLTKKRNIQQPFSIYLFPKLSTSVDAITVKTGFRN